MWVKICANTSLADAQMAVDLGADAVGFVFAPSARRVTPEEAGAITAGLRGEVERVGVFPEWDLDAVRSAVRAAGLTGVQMHGAYRREVVRGLREEFGDAVTIAQVLHWVVAEPKDANAVEQKPTGALVEGLLGRVNEITADGLVDRMLVDSKVGSALGGTGRIFDWEAAEALFRHAGTARMIVAGGLKPENVEQAIGRLEPWGVDVASGVESVPGIKDPERLRLFLARARAVGK